MELKKRNWQCRYMREFLAVGEAPIGVRNCFQQKSRWCKVNALLCVLHRPPFPRRFHQAAVTLLCLLL